MCPITENTVCTRYRYKSNKSLLAETVLINILVNLTCLNNILLPLVQRPNTGELEKEAWQVAHKRKQKIARHREIVMEYLVILINCPCSRQVSCTAIV